MSQKNKYIRFNKGDTIKKALALCENAMIYISAFSTLILMLLTTADAAGRYFFNMPITGAYEITTNYLMIAAIFMALSYGYKHESCIRVTFMVSRLKGKVRLAVNYLVQAISTLYGFTLVYATYKQAARVFEMHTTLSTLDFIPVGPAYVIVPMGLFFMSLLMLIDISKVKDGKSCMFTDEETSLMI